MQGQQIGYPPVGYPPAGGMPGAAPDGANTLDPTGKYNLKNMGAYVACEVNMNGRDAFKSEGGAMISMSSNVHIDTHMEGNFCQACCRCCCAGESFFFSDFNSKDGNACDVLVAPKVPGEIIMVNMDGQVNWKIQKGSYLCCDPTIKIGTVLQGCCQGLGSGEGFVILEAQGSGRLVLNSYGSIIRYDLQPGERRTIDNGALVAWTGHTEYTVGLASQQGGFFGRAFRSALTGEGFVCRFVGPGTIFVQTRSFSKLAMALFPHLPEEKKPKK